MEFFSWVTQTLNTNNRETKSLGVDRVYSMGIIISNFHDDLVQDQ